MQNACKNRNVLVALRKNTQQRFVGIDSTTKPVKILLGPACYPVFLLCLMFQVNLFDLVDHALNSRDEFSEVDSLILWKCLVEVMELLCQSRSLLTNDLSY